MRNRLAAGGVGLALLLGVFEAFGPLSMDLYMPTLPALARDLGTTDGLAQWSMSVCMIGLGLGQLIAGPLSDRVGRRLPLVVGVAGFALFSFACAMAPTIEVLLAVRAAQGLCGAAGIVTAMAIARDLYSGVELSRMLSLLGVVGALAPVIAPIIGGQLARVTDWRGVFVVLGTVGTLIAAAAALLVPETLDGSARHGGGAQRTLGEIGTVLRDPVFVGVLTAGALAGTGFFAYLSMISFVLEGGYGLSPQEFSLVFAANALAALLGGQASRPIVRRFGPLLLHLGSYTAAALAAGVLIASVLAFGLPGLIVCVLLCMFTSGIGGPNGSTLALEDHGARAGTAAALLGTVSTIVGPVVAPFVLLLGTTPLIFAVTLCAGFGAATLVAWACVLPAVRRRTARHAAAREPAPVTEPIQVAGPPEVGSIPLG
ncbi:MAG: multidrug effflux MFS transporter [Microbacteriaceae bacterium]